MITILKLPQPSLSDAPIEHCPASPYTGIMIRRHSLVTVSNIAMLDDHLTLTETITCQYCKFTLYRKTPVSGVEKVHVS